MTGRLSTESRGSFRRSTGHVSSDGPAIKLVNRFADSFNICVKRLLGCVGLRGKAFQTAFYISLPSAVLAFFVRGLASAGVLPWFNPDDPKHVQIETTVWTGITSVLGFLVVFRASQAYGRYWQAMTSVHLMRADWFDSCSAVCSFCCTSGSNAEKSHKVRTFKNLLVRLFSLMHAGGLLKLIETEADNDWDIDAGMLPLIDPSALDKMSADAFHNSEYKVELVSQWIQHMIVKGVEEGLLTAPSPIVSRSFNQLANGMVQFHDALKVKTIPYPQQYAQVCELLLTMHWLVTPFTISLWVNSPILATLFTFVAVFVLWALARVAAIIENPFNMLVFLHSALDMQEELNNQLLLMLDPMAMRVPVLPGLEQVALYTNEFGSSTLDEFEKHDCQHVLVDHDTLLEELRRATVAAALDDDIDPHTGRMSTRRTRRVSCFMSQRSLQARDPEDVPSFEQVPRSFSLYQVTPGVGFPTKKTWQGLQTAKVQDPIDNDGRPPDQAVANSEFCKSGDGTGESRKTIPPGLPTKGPEVADRSVLCASPEGISVEVAKGGKGDNIGLRPLCLNGLAPLGCAMGPRASGEETPWSGDDMYD